MSTQIWTEADKLEWLKRDRRKVCPDCDGHTISGSLVKNTCWCPVCDRVWKVQRITQSWWVFWFYTNRDRTKDDMRRHNKGVKGVRFASKTKREGSDPARDH